MLSDYGGTFQYNISGGTLSGLDAYYSGTINQSGGSVSASSLWIGRGRGGTYCISDGTLQAGYVSVGADSGGSSILTISNSTGSGNTSVTLTGTNGAYIGGGGQGTLNISGGTSALTMAPSRSGAANAPGTVNQTGGVVAGTGLVFGRSSNSSGTYNLNGGMLIVPSIGLDNAETAAFNFGGGTLQASGSFNCALPMTLTGSGGNATVDTAGNTVTLSGSLSGPGGLTKTDSGTLVLSASNTYTGGTNRRGRHPRGLQRQQWFGYRQRQRHPERRHPGQRQRRGHRLRRSGDRQPCLGDRPRRQRLDRQTDHRQPAGRLEPDHAQLRPDHARWQRRPACSHRQPGTSPEHGDYVRRRPTTPGDYRLIGYGSLTGSLSDFSLPAAPSNRMYSLSTTVDDPGYIDLVVVPEPSTLVLLGVAAAGLLAWGRRRR